MVNEISLVGFFPEFGVFPVKHCVYVCVLLLGSLCFSLLVNSCFISIVKFLTTGIRAILASEGRLCYEGFI